MSRIHEALKKAEQENLERLKREEEAHPRWQSRRRKKKLIPERN